jgi:flavin reductase (DIM6/NTAB) family NADH-FMN oxidoreductase RutF
MQYDNRDVVSQEQFRALMRKFASSVAVITTRHDGVDHGMTATAVCSVSVDPPSILVVVNRASRSYPLISASRRFVVNILSDDQRALSQRFAKDLDDKFSGIRIRPGIQGIPIIEGAAAIIECVISSEAAAETHTIFVGRVVGGEVASGLPLVYQDASYKSLVASCAI